MMIKARIVTSSTDPQQAFRFFFRAIEYSARKFGIPGVLCPRKRFREAYRVMLASAPQALCFLDLPQTPVIHSLYSLLVGEDICMPE